MIFQKTLSSWEVSPGVVLDYDDEDNLVGIDIDNASLKLDLKELVLNKIPVEKQTIAAWSFRRTKMRLIYDYEAKYVQKLV